MKITRASKKNIDMILDNINREFIVSRGKQLHIFHRFPYLFDKSNYNNIFLLNENKNDFGSIIAVKPVSFTFRNSNYKAFFVGTQITPNHHRGKGFGKLLFQYTANHYLNNGYDIGIGWTRLQNFYSGLGWIPFENGIYVETKKNDNKLIDVSKNNKNGYNDIYERLDSFRTTICSDYIIRNKGNKIEGYGTIYSPGEEAYCIYYEVEGSIYGYLYGVKSNKNIIIYEMHYRDISVLKELLNKLSYDGSDLEICFNVSCNDSNLLFLLDKFDKLIISKPKLGIYYFKNKQIFDYLKYFYIPFTDRI